MAIVDLESKIRKECMRRGYSIRTADTYVYCVGKFLRWSDRVVGKELKRISKGDVRIYLDMFIEKGSSGSTVNTYLHAIRFFFEKVLRRKLTIYIPRSKVKKKIPEYLNKDEVVRLISSIDNKKHRLLVILLYSAGLRVSELVNLKVCDLNIDEGYGWVRNGKGGKDRPFIIANKLRDNLDSWITENNLSHDSWLFYGNNGNHISVSSIQQVVGKARRKAGIKKRVHPHSLRHTFATHIIDGGYGLATLQPLLGHSRIETTLAYTHTASVNLLGVVSPYDNLEIEQDLMVSGRSVDRSDRVPPSL